MDRREDRMSVLPLHKEIEEEAVVWDTDEAAAFLRISPRTLVSWRSRGMGPTYVKVGRRVVYLQRDIVAWLYQQRST
jgi:predicted DNA-binding transcriptional regulator AlpA